MNRPADMAVFVTAFFIYSALLIQTADKYGYDEAQAKCKPLPKVEFEKMTHKQQVRWNDGLGRGYKRRQDMTFDEWWKQTKPAECDELKPYFEEAWELSAATEREACADVAGFAERWIGDWIARYGNRSVSDAIRERPNV